MSLTTVAIIIAAVFIVAPGVLARVVMWAASLALGLGAGAVAVLLLIGVTSALGHLLGAR